MERYRAVRIFAGLNGEFITSFFDPLDGNFLLREE
jgi:hypothetical protein